MNVVGIEKENLRTSFFHSGKNYDKVFFLSKKDYKARLTVTVSIDSLPLLEPAIIKVSEAKPEIIHNINFTLKDNKNIKMEAFKKAIIKAKDKANLLSSQMGVSLGNVLYIEEVRKDGRSIPIHGVSNRANPFNEFYAVRALNYKNITDTGFFAQVIKFDCTVKVIIELSTER